jgi:hypothetical protein
MVPSQSLVWCIYRAVLVLLVVELVGDQVELGVSGGVVVKLTVGRCEG